MRLKRSLVALACVSLALVACGSNNDNASGGTTGGASVEPTELTVFAGSSLTAALTQIGSDFEAANPGTTVTFNFGSSGDLASAIESEGTADVFASASGTYMDEVSDKVGVSGRADFVQNKLVIITPPDNPANIASLEDLAKPGVQVVLAAEGVPVGDYARQSLESAGIKRTSWRTSSPTRKTTHRSSRRSPRARPTPPSCTCPTSRAPSRRRSLRWRSPTTSTWSRPTRSRWCRHRPTPISRSRS